MTRREQLIASLNDEEYRYALVDRHIAAMLPFQLRALREQRGWTQKQLGERCGKKQEWICKLESPQYARFTLQTLRTLARAFDVALEVKFVPFSNLIGWMSTRRQGDLRVPSFAEDAALREPPDSSVSAEVRFVTTATTSARLLAFPQPAQSFETRIDSTRSTIVRDAVAV